MTSFFSHADRNHAVPKPPALLAHCCSRTTCLVAPPLAPDPTHLEGFRKPGTTRSSTSLAPPTMDSSRSPTQDPPLSLRLHPQRHCYREPRAPPTSFRAGTLHRSPRPRPVHQNLPSQSRAARVKPLTTLFIPSSTLQEPATGISSFCAGSALSAGRAPPTLPQAPSPGGATRSLGLLPVRPANQRCVWCSDSSSEARRWGRSGPYASGRYPGQPWKGTPRSPQPPTTSRPAPRGTPVSTTAATGEGARG